MRRYLILLLLIIVIYHPAVSQLREKSKLNARAAYKNAIDAIVSGKFQDAYSYLAMSIENDPSFLDAKFTMAKVKTELGMTEEAIADMKSLTEENKTNGEYLFFLGYLQFQGDTCSDVLDHFNQAVLLGYESPDVFYYRGLCKYLHDDFRGAIADFTRTIEMESNHYMAYHDRGTAKRALGDFQGALNDYRMSVNFNHNFPVAFNNMGSVKIILGDYEGAIQDYTVAITLNPAFVMAYNNRGTAHYHMERYDEALVDFEQAVMVDEEYIPAIINKASILSKNKRYSEALELYNKALDKTMEKGIIFYNRGLIKELTGDIKGACEDWNNAVIHGITEAEKFKQECN